jgi:hypothetical protein
MDPQMVAGEPVHVLLKAFQQLKLKKTSSGRVRISAILDRELALPLQRALMRIERALISHDIDRLGRPGVQTRTPEGRRADALTALALRLAEGGRVPDGVARSDPEQPAGT